MCKLCVIHRLGVLRVLYGLILLYRYQQESSVATNQALVFQYRAGEGEGGRSGAVKHEPRERRRALAHSLATSTSFFSHMFAHACSTVDFEYVAPVVHDCRPFYSNQCLAYSKR